MAAAGFSDLHLEMAWVTLFFGAGVSTGSPQGDFARPFSPKCPICQRSSQSFTRHAAMYSVRESGISITLSLSGKGE